MRMRLLKLGVSVAVLALLVRWSDGGAILERLRRADPAWLGVALATLTLVTCLMARRWQIVAGVLGIRIPFARALSEYYIAQFVNAVVPGGILGDVGRAVRVRGAGDLVRAAQSVAAERIIGQSVLFALMGTGFACALVVRGGTDWPASAWLGVLALVAVAFVAALGARRQTGSARFVRLVLDQVKTPRMLAYSLTIAILLIVGFYACARATGTVIGLRDLFTLVPLILSAMIIPLSVGGWGWREGAAAALFPVIGASADAGIAAGIAYGAMITLAALPAVLFWLSPQEAPSMSQKTGLDLP